MNRIVLTGANGFVGSALAKKLHDNGNDVICLIRKNSNTNLIEHKSTIRQIDYSDIDSLESVIRNADVFIHIAALTRARKWDTFKKNNIDLTNKLLQICNKHSIKQFILL
ncbi:MAG: NAD(P)-dependent oxidoreductase, partial [Candidatus Cloacimonetes bacterium]|nr:NAD(P)-dependent oxidoreductase [Candidatus Cloacimonadota bacterium]